MCGAGNDPGVFALGTGRKAELSAEWSGDQKRKAAGQQHAPPGQALRDPL